MPRATSSIFRLAALLPIAVTIRIRSGGGGSIFARANVYGDSSSSLPVRTVVRSATFGRRRNVLANISPLDIKSKTETTSTTNSSTAGNKTRKKFRLVQVQIVHRHGDRTPITPMKDEDYWSAALPHPNILDRIARGTKLIRDDSKRVSHKAGGRGPFGKLTNLGLLQMVELGQKIREELHLDYDQQDDIDAAASDRDDDNDDELRHFIDEHGHCHVNHGKLFCPRYPIHPRRIRVTSTDFPRTIESVQGLLVGLFPNGLPPITTTTSTTQDENVHKIKEKKQSPSSLSSTTIIEIDVRHTNIMIPDAQPRRSKEQEILESVLASQPHLQQKEMEMKDLAVRVTEALRHIVAEDAHTVSFGVGEEKSHRHHHHQQHSSDDSDKMKVDSEADETLSTTATAAIQPLPWSQLSEITKCLRVRNLLPPDITPDDQETISAHAAWRWFETLRHPRLAKLAMHDLVSRMLDVFHQSAAASSATAASTFEEEEEEEEHPRLHIYSAHDSTLIGLICAFRLEQPATWPEYGSYLKLELIEVETTMAKDKEEKKDGTSNVEKMSDIEYFVRFSLNGQVLKCYWGIDEDGMGEPAEMIPLEHLSAMIHSDYHHDVENYGDEMMDKLISSLNELEDKNKMKNKVKKESLEQ